ncbi:MAG: c-type cytochrome [Armatimonadota bacterium]|nr:c-type cytochrome [Armatimonadota bacterium]MDR7520623.1 c-type cytochrome [Armatimonadota bacterium]
MAFATVAAGCQPTLRVRGQAATAGAGLPQAPAAKALAPTSPRPSAERGRAVFERACWPCHGNTGLGDGPAAAGLVAPHKNPMTDFFGMFGIKIKGEDLPSRPANFHNQVAMRLNAPFSLFEVIKLGRPHTAMPAFGPKAAYGANRGFPTLTDAQIWDVLFYEWTFATTPAAVERGRRIYQEQAIAIGGQPVTCAACHGPAGDGRGGARSAEMAARVWGWDKGVGPGIFTDVNRMLQQKPAELFQRIVRGHGLMPAYGDLLGEEDVWALVDYLWTFVYDYRPARGQ